MIISRLPNYTIRIGSSIIISCLLLTVTIASSSAASTIDGDFNNDSKLDATDLSILLSHYGKNPAVYEQGDVNRNARVDNTDIMVFKTVYKTFMSGSVTPPPTTPTTPPTPEPTTGKLLWISDYDTLSPGVQVSPAWAKSQEPHFPGATGPIREEALSVVGPASVPGSGAYKPVRNAMRAELRPYNNGTGDVMTIPGSTSTYNRAETYDRQPTNPKTTPAASWPDPIGSTRWYSYSVFIPSDFVTDPNKDNNHWLVLTQFKGLNGGSPPLAIGIEDGNFTADSDIKTVDNLDNKYTQNNLGSINKGQWTHLEIGVHWSTEKDGWLNIYKNGVEILPKEYRRTMGTYQNLPDPIYLKQGIYRGKAWSATHIMYFDKTKIGETRASVK